MEDLQTSWAERLSREQEAKQKRIDELEAEEKQKDRVPYLWNLNEDLSLCAKIIHFLPEGMRQLLNINLMKCIWLFNWLLVHYILCIFSYFVKYFNFNDHSNLKNIKYELLL